MMIAPAVARREPTIDVRLTADTPSYVAPTLLSDSLDV